MVLIFFEIDKVNIERFYFNRLSTNSTTNKIVVVLEDPEELASFRIEYPEIEAYQFRQWLLGAARRYKDSVVFINGNRIPDLLMTKISRENSCQVVFIQHGMYVDFMKREISFFLNKIHKSLRYAAYAIRLRCVLRLFKVHVLGYSRNLTASRTELFPHFAFVHSEYWKEWHANTYFFDNNVKYGFLSNNDSNQDAIEFKDTVTYCYQTLVEDGRIDVSYFWNVLEEIIRVIKRNGLQLVVKGHPRMSQTSKEFFSSNGISVVTSEFPTGGLVIGHYSTLLARWVYNKDALIVVELDGHEIPDPIRNMATVVCSISELPNVISKNIKGDADNLKSLSDYYFNFSGSKAVHHIHEILRFCDEAV